MLTYWDALQGFGDWMTEEDMLVDLPGTVWINDYPFVLLETDKVNIFYLSPTPLCRESICVPLLFPFPCLLLRRVLMSLCRGM